MWMEVHIYSVKAKSQAGNVLSQRYNDNIKRQKHEDTQLGILKIWHFARKFGRGPQIQERALLALCSICL